MTIPNNQPPSPAIPFAVTGFGGATDGSGTTSADLASRTLSAIQALLGQTEIQESAGWNASSQSAYAGLTQGIPYSLAIIEQFVSKITGLPIGSWATINEALLAMQGIASNQDLQNNWTTVLTDFGVPNASGLASAIVAASGGNWLPLLTDLFGSNIAIALTGGIAAPAVTNTPHSAQPVPNFPNAASLVEVSYNGGGWSWDGTLSYTDPLTGVISAGSAKCTANGAVQAQNGVIVQVQPGQTVSLAPEVQWSGLAAAGGTSPIQAQLVTWSGTTSPGTAAAPTLLAEITSPGANEASWTALTPVTNSGAGVAAGVYTVPPSGVGFVQARIEVTPDATAGDVWWNGCDTIISGGFLPTMNDDVAALIADGVAANAATQTFLGAIKTANTSDAGNIPQWWTDVGAAYKIWASAESGIAQSALATLDDIGESMLGINPTTKQMSASNVGNIFGGASLDDDLTSLATSLFGAPAVAAITTAENDIANFLSNSLSGGSAPTSPNSVVSFLDGLFDIVPHSNLGLPQNPGTGAITFDVDSPATPYTGAGSSTITLGPWNITPGADANYVTVRLGFYASGPTYNFVTCDGVAMQLLEQAVSPNGNIVTQIYGVASLTPGVANSIAATLNCPFGQVDIAAATADTYIGVGSVAVNSVPPNSGANSSPTLTVASAVDEYILHAAIVESSGGGVETLSVTLPSGYVTQYNSGAIGSTIKTAFLAGDAPGASSVSFADTAGYTVTDQWATCAVNLIPLPATVLGSTFRVANTITSPAVSSVSGNNLFPNSFFNATPNPQSADLTWNPATANEVVITQAGTYTVTISVLINAAYFSQWIGLNLYQNGALVERGNTAWIGASSAFTVVSHTFQIYCSANDTLQPGYYASVAASAFNGTTAGDSTYFKVSLHNRGLLS